MMSVSKHRLGFSLLELSIVIAVVALIAGTGVSIAAGALKAADRISTQEKLNIIKLALDSHAKTYGYLPCPAKRDITPSDATFGVESRYDGTTAFTLGNSVGPTGTNKRCSYTGTPVGFTGITSANNVLYGVVPVRSLGLPDSYAGDAWGNKFTYALSYVTDSGLASLPASYSTNRLPYITVNYGVPTGTNYTVTMQRLYDTAGDVTSNGGIVRVSNATTAPVLGDIVNFVSTNYRGSNAVTNVTGVHRDFSAAPWTADENNITMEWLSAGAGASYVVISHGPNGKGAYPMNGTTVPVACSAVGAEVTIDDYNCDDSSATFYDAEYNDDGAAANYFDDYIIWGSNAQARKPVSNSLYTSSSTNNCPTGVCEAWCAVCDKNYPTSGGSTSVPPTGVLDTADSTAAIFLCKKVITSNSTDCKAACFWAGHSSANGYYKCP